MLPMRVVKQEKRSSAVRSLVRHLAALSQARKRIEPGIAMVKTPVRGSIDVRSMRLRTRGAIGATQQCFANAIGISVKTLRNW